MKQAINVHQRHPYSRRATDLHGVALGRWVSTSPRLSWLGDRGCERFSLGAGMLLTPASPRGFCRKPHRITSKRKLQPAGFMNPPSFPLFFYFHSYFLLLFLLYWPDQMFQTSGNGMLIFQAFPHDVSDSSGERSRNVSVSVAGSTPSLALPPWPQLNWVTSSISQCQEAQF